MEDYELEADVIISWAISYADYEELEKVAKAIYSVYKSRQRSEKLDDYKKAKDYKKRIYKQRRVNKKRTFDKH